MEIVPPYEHWQTDVLFKAGILAIMTVEHPGVQGADVMGVQGVGVKTPLAAAVADAVAGFAILVHITNPGIFTKGL